MITNCFFRVFLGILVSLSVMAAPRLPKSVNIVTGIPLTLPEYALEQMGLKPEQNTGGWGDVMSNVAMALDIKKQFPNIDVRLIVTLNDAESRPYVNRVRNFIPKVLVDENERPFLDPDAKGPQMYKGIEVYFASVPEGIGHSSVDNLKPKEIKKVMASVRHIPSAEMGLQYSANDSAFSKLVVKAENMHVYFQEYSEEKGSHAYSYFHENAEMIKIFAGPLAFGVYGFGSKGDAIHSAENKSHVQAWLNKVQSNNPQLAGINLDLKAIDLAFAYAGDALMIEDYSKAIDQIAKQNRSKVTVVAFKGKGEIRKVGNRIYVPLNDHPKELAHALVSESTYSPLVTGDGSLSSALETTSKTKSFLYENVEWKAMAMSELFRTIFKDEPELLKSANDMMVVQTSGLKQAKMSRKARVEQITRALQNQDLHSGIHSYFTRRTMALNIADNTMNIYQFEEIYKTLKSSFEKKSYFSESYLKWLINFTKSFDARDAFPVEKLKEQLNDQVYGRSNQLLEKWYSLFTLWELGYTVETPEIARVIEETKSFLEGRQTVAKLTMESDLIQTLEQVFGAKKSKQALVNAMTSDSRIRENFEPIRKAFHKQNNHRFLFPLRNSCSKFYMD